MSPVESGNTIRVMLQAGVWTCFPPDALPVFHNMKHDAIQCAILWAYVNRPARAILQGPTGGHVLCIYDGSGHAEVFEPLSA